MGNQNTTSNVNNIRQSQRGTNLGAKYQGIQTQIDNARGALVKRADVIIQEILAGDTQGPDYCKRLVALTLDDIDAFLSQQDASILQELALDIGVQSNRQHDIDEIKQNLCAKIRKFYALKFRLATDIVSTYKTTCQLPLDTQRLDALVATRRVPPNVIREINQELEDYTRDANSNANNMNNLISQIRAARTQQQLEALIQPVGEARAVSFSSCELYNKRLDNIQGRIQPLSPRASVTIPTTAMRESQMTPPQPPVQSPAEQRASLRTSTSRLNRFLQQRRLSQKPLVPPQDQQVPTRTSTSLLNKFLQAPQQQARINRVLQPPPGIPIQPQWVATRDYPGEDLQQPPAELILTSFQLGDKLIDNGETERDIYPGWLWVEKANKNGTAGPYFGYVNQQDIRAITS